MSHERWIVIPKWDKFQHYHDRNAPWIKNYTDLVHRDEYLELAPTARALLHGIWLLYELGAGVVRASSVQPALRMRAGGEHWNSLIHAGFIEISASKPLALTRARVRAGALARGEETKSKNPQTPADAGAPKSTLSKKRRKAERWIDNGLADQVPTEHLRDVLADEFDIHDPELLTALMAKAQPKELQ